MMKTPNILLAALSFLLVLSSCEKEPADLSSGNELLEFRFDAGFNPALDSTYTAQIVDNSVTVVIPKHTDVSNLVASFELSEGATLWVSDLEQQSGITSNDFSDTLEYMVVAEDGSAVSYQVYISFLSRGILWTKTSEFPGMERSNAVGFVIGEKFYTGMGDRFMEPFQLYDWYAYDPGSDQWSTIAEFPVEGAQALFAFSIQGKGYVAVDSSGELCDPVCVWAQKKELWQYDPQADQWSFVLTLEEFQQSATYFEYVEVIRNKAYLVDSNSASGRGVIEFDPATGTIRQVSSYDAFLIFGSTFELNGNIYFMTGSISSEFDQRMYAFDPVSTTWNKLADFPGEGRRFASGFSLGDYGFVTSGEGKEQINANTYQYVPVSDTWMYGPPEEEQWIQIADAPGEAAYNKTAISNGDMVLLGCGRTMNGLLKEFWTGRIGSIIE